MKNKKEVNYLKNKKLLLFILILTIIFSNVSFGDTGNNVNYDSGSDYSYDSGGSGDGGLIFNIIYILFSVLPWPLKIILIGAIVILYIKNKDKFTKSNIKNGVQLNKSKNRTLNINNTSKEIEEIIKRTDVNFSSDKFLSWAEEVFMTLQHAWTKRDWDMIRSFEKEELYRKHQLQLQEYIDNGTINVVERIQVNDSYLIEYVENGEYEFLKVLMRVRLNDYIIDEHTKEVLKGDKNTEHHMIYELKFMRKLGVKTDAATSNMSTKQCPHCRAPLAITSSGKCEYCDTIVTTGEFDWVLSDLDSI